MKQMNQFNPKPKEQTELKNLSNKSDIQDIQDIQEYDLKDDTQRKAIFEGFQHRINQIDQKLSDLVMQYS